MRIALFAYDCAPGAGSDPGLGWQAAMVAAAVADEVTVFTRSSYQRSIERVPTPANLRFEYLHLRERIGGPLRTGRAVFDAAHCLLWLRRAVDRALELDRDRPFDLTQFATFSAYWMPGPFWRFDRPHLMGPVTGGERTHPTFRALQSPRARAADSARDAMMAAAVRHPDWVRTCRSSRTLCVAATDVTASRLRDAGAARVETFRPPYSLEPAMLAELRSLAAATPRSERPTLVVSGRQVAWKGADWAVRALVEVRRELPDVTLHLIGEGPQHDVLRALARDLGVDGAIVAHGRLERDAERRLIAASHALLFPSTRDAGAVILQFAMALGTPVVGFDIGAARSVVGDAGVLVDPAAEGGPAAALGAAACSVLRDADLGRRLVDRGHARLEGELSYDHLLRESAGWFERARSDG